MSSSFSTESSIRGHHIYKDIWTPQVDERLYCKPEVGNIHDPYAVAVKRPSDNTVVGHVPRKVSAVCCFFLRRGSITCVVTGSRRHSSDLPQGGLEVPCTLTFIGSEDDTTKVRKLWNRAPVLTPPSPFVPKVEPKITSSNETCLNEEPPSKKPKLEVHRELSSAEACSDDDEWVSFTIESGRTVTLSLYDKSKLTCGGLLTDKHITFAQELLRYQFPGTQGLRCTLYQDKGETEMDHGIQIVHDRSNHWIVACNLKRTDNIIEIYDSLFTTVTNKTRATVTNLFQPIPGKKPRLKNMKSQKQQGSQDCGLFAIAIVTAILFNQDTSTKFSQQRMRDHLVQCFEDKLMTQFPTEIM